MTQNLEVTMSNKKQSSIEWLEWQINLGLSERGLISAFKQAKAMHKEEIKDAWLDGEWWDSEKDGEQYYNETFGGNDENSIGEKLYTKDEVLDLLVNMNSWPTTFEGREDITEWFEQGQYY